MSHVKVITFRPVKDPKQVQVAVTAFVKHWVKQRNDAGESTLEIAKSLGFKSHASVVQYLTPEHPVKVSDAVQRRVAELAFGGSRDRLDEEALRWFAEQTRKSDTSEFPPQFKAALFLLRETKEGRDFTDAARIVLQRAAQRPEQMTVDAIADEIYQTANEEKGKSVVSAVEVTSDGAELGRPKRAKK